MKSVQPSADLPPTNSHIMLTYNSLPARFHRAMPRNMTGVYLGNDVPPNMPRTYHSVPPLAKPRGTLFRPWTPVETQKRQQQRVEALRVREEPRGFQPRAVRKAKPKLKVEQKSVTPPANNSQSSPVLRKSVRNFVAASNSGVTHLEDLGLDELSLRSVSTGRESSTAHSIMEDIQHSNKKIVGLEECYRRICKGNLSSLQSLLPARKAVGTTNARTKTVATPLTIRSFRNPRSPHAVVQYSDLRSKPKSISPSKPPVPSPFYYSSKGLPKAADEGGNRIRLTRFPVASHSSDRVLAAPGVGVLSRRSASLQSEPPPCIEGMPPPSTTSNAKFIDSEDIYTQQDAFKVPSGTPAVSRTDLHTVSFSSSSSTSEELQNKGTTGTPNASKNSQPQPKTPPTTPVARFNNNHNSSVHSDGTNEPATNGGECTDEDITLIPKISVSIVISVEGVSGESRLVDLEDDRLMEDESDDGDRAERGRPDGDQPMQEWQDASETKQSELQKLLEEHQEIVSHIEELEKLT